MFKILMQIEVEQKLELKKKGSVFEEFEDLEGNRDDANEDEESKGDEYEYADSLFVSRDVAHVSKEYAALCSELK